MADAYEGLTVTIMLKAKSSSKYVRLGTVLLGSEGVARFTAKSKFTAGSVLRLMIGGKVIKSVTIK
jgi:hypothetical protein